MQRFTSARHTQRFLSVHARIHNHFELRRYRITAAPGSAEPGGRAARDDALGTWRKAVGIAAAA